MDRVSGKGYFRVREVVQAVRELRDAAVQHKALAAFENLSKTSLAQQHV